ncbi:Qat anti-phage system ATPase QatA [Salinisphaera sp. LB1]|uniref:Qat anti-phage system ATPase QatA n=1 Tax=Salinisphaera sp. LB1 TaxID=2183911 RepID=UPI000D7060F8|nr:Qat anti-phage system ATPase QatA [Salinisphaera sp. LB1]AWN17952.1 Phage T7 exclusion protein [Salinisphaera sp. LB1]
MIVADNETAVDLLYYEAIAKTVVRLVNEKSDEPLSVGVHGDWGAGKSSVLMMVEETFSDDDRVLCVRFNGWLFQGFEDAKAVLIETIVEELRHKRPTSQKVAEQAKKVLRRVDWMKLARKAGAYGLTLATGIPHPETIRDLGAAARSLISKGAEDVSRETVAALVDGSNEFLREVAEDNASEQMHAFREEFAELLEHARIDRLIVLVDDLDRCLPDTAIETLEAIRLFLFVPRAAFVIAADEGMIEYAVRQHFPDLPVATGPATYARNYLEKLIQVPFRLPSLGYAETRIYVTLLLVLNACGEESGEFQKLTELAREVLRRPWKGPGLDRKAVEKALGGVPAEVERAMELAGRIAPVLAEGARGNPRQIKRFINTMMLRLAIAEERGFRDELNISVLAKIMLAERFAPELYDAMARGSANTGASEELAALEAAVAAPPPDQEAKSEKGKEKALPAEVSLPDWPNLEWAKQWAAIDPPLAENDLRPYVFVTRDRRSVFGAVTSLGELDELIAKLQGSPLQVKQAAAEVARLQSIEAEQVFDALRAKVRDAEDLTQEPVGVKGLAEIARQHPFLQRPLLSFVQDLPISKLGPWVVSGWASVFSEAEVASDFATTLKGWADQDDNKQLRAAATAAMKLSSKRKRP